MQKNSLIKNLQLAQDNFIRSIEGAGDILAFETKRKKNKLVLQGLGKIKSIIDKLLAIRLTDPSRFDRLMLSKEFQDLYSQNKENATLALNYDADRFLAPFSAAIGQILRVHQEAIEAGNEEVSTHAAYNINWLLSSICPYTGYDLIIRELVKSLRKMNIKAINGNDKSMYSTSFDWYIESVINVPEYSGKGFCFEYLDTFDSYFISSIKEIIDKDRQELFNHFTQMMVEGSYNLGNNWPNLDNIRYPLMDLDPKSYFEIDKQLGIGVQLQELSESYNEVSEKDDLLKWLNRFDVFTKTISSAFTGDMLVKFDKTIPEIKQSAEKAFKLFNLDLILFGLLAYCVYREKPMLLRKFVEYHQPKDSNAHWLNREILPSTLAKLVEFFFKNNYKIKDKFYFWDEHHGAELYIQQLFLLLTCRFLQNINSNQDGKYAEIDNFELPKMDIFSVSNIDFTVDQLLRAVPQLHTKKDQFIALGIDTNDLVELIDQKLTLFLRSLKEKAVLRITDLHRAFPVSQSKIDQYKVQLLQGYKESVKVRLLFNQNNLIVDNSSGIYKGNTPPFGVSTLAPKGAFLEKWHVRYMNWGSETGKNIGVGEDRHLIEVLAKQCKSTDWRTFENIINKPDHVEQHIAISLDSMAGWNLRNQKFFTPRWQEKEEVPSMLNSEGTLHFGKNKIPMYQIWATGAQNKILILDVSKMGKIVQLSPIDSEEDNQFRVENFLLKVRSFGDEPDFLQSYMKLDPKCLKDISNENDKINFLKERVLIHAFERYEYCPPVNFTGYFIEVNEEEQMHKE